MAKSIHVALSTKHHDVDEERTLSKTFRLFGNKMRGRSSVSQFPGSLGETVLFASLWVVGCATFLILLFNAIIPEVQVNWEYAQTVCEIRDYRIETIQDGQRTEYRPALQIHYKVEGESFTIWAFDLSRLDETEDSHYRDEESAWQALRPFYKNDHSFAHDKDSIIGRKFLCWYDPNAPKDVVLLRGYRFAPLLTIILVLALVVVTTIGLILRLIVLGKSPERRADSSATNRRCLRMIDPVDGTERDYPTVPDVTSLNDSPGTRLDYRLPVVDAAAGLTFSLLLVTIAWNGLMAVFVVMFFHSIISGTPDWHLAAFIIPFLGIGIWILVRLMRRIRSFGNVGPTLVEISRHPLHPGDTCRIHISQSGLGDIQRFEVSLICEETSIYRQGTNMLSDSQVVFSRRLVSRDTIECRRNESYEIDATLTVPDGAMHSFVSSSNSIRWKLLVEGCPPGNRPLHRELPVVICPSTRRSDA